MLSLLYYLLPCLLGSAPRSAWLPLLAQFLSPEPETLPWKMPMVSKELAFKQGNGLRLPVPKFIVVWESYTLETCEGF